VNTITYYPHLVNWNDWMDGTVEVDGKFSAFDFISRGIADGDAAEEGDTVYEIPTIVLDEFSAINAVAALAHWYAKVLGKSVTAKIFGSGIECTATVQV